jgi:hypothetical protein
MGRGPIRARRETAARVSQAAARARKAPSGRRLTERMKAMTRRNFRRASARWRGLSRGR